MQKRIAITLGVALTMFLFAGTSTPSYAQAAQSKAEQEVLKVVDDALTALVKRDIALIERTFTNDYYTV